MSHLPSDNPSAWLDEALRDVPLPPDLIARLRRLGLDSDGELGEVLRRVPVPQELTARLKQIPDDLELDRRIRQVAVRSGLLAALKEIPAVAQAVPAAARGHTPERPTWWIVAASLLAVATLAVLGYVADVRRVTADSGAATVAEGRLTVLDDGRAPTVLPSHGEIATESIRREGFAPMSEPPDSLARRLDRPASEIVAREGSVLESAGLAGAPLLDAPLAAMDQLAMPDSVSGPRRMGMVPLGGASRLVPPTTRGFDWTSYLRYGAFPFVSPADHPQLATLALPLVSGSPGARDFRELLGGDEPSAPQDVRTEQLLAGIDYQYPLPKDKAVALYASGGPSPWNRIERKFLLLGVQARESEPHDRSPVDVTFVIDASLNTPGLDGLAACREALEQSLAALQREDRVSIVLAAQRPIWLAKGIAAAAEDELAAAVEQLGRVTPQPIVDVVPALEAAIQQAPGDDVMRRKLVVCVTTDLTYVGQSDEQNLSRLAAAGASQGLRLEVVQLSPLARRDEVSRRLARAGGGDVHSVAGPRELWSVLHQLLTEKSPIVARDVSLTLQFDPKTVESYRVLGHEMHAVGPERGRGTVDLLLRDTCVVTMELSLRPGVAGEVATARLEWRDPQTSEVESIVQRISPAQFATSLGEATLPVQRATLVAMTAEILRRTPAVPADATLQDVVDEAAAVDGRLWDEAWLVDLIDAIGASGLTQGASRPGSAPRPFGF